jgi:hypothetical protein
METFRKRQKEQRRKEKREEKLARRLERKHRGQTTPETGRPPEPVTLVAVEANTERQPG